MDLKDKKFYCPKCSQDFPSKSKLKAHSWKSHYKSLKDLQKECDGE